jgi:hypothetical protein
MSDSPIASRVAFGSERAAGVVVEYDQALFFVPASVAQRIVPKPVVSRVPGTELGIALVSGKVTSVIDVEQKGGELLVCDVGGEAVAFSGMKVVGCGFYPRRGNGIALGDELVPELDVTALLRRRGREDR